MADLLANKLTSNEEDGEEDGAPGLASAEEGGNWKGSSGAPNPVPSSSSSSSSSSGNVPNGGGVSGGILGTKMPASWDPSLAMENRHPTKECLCRIRNDMKSLLVIKNLTLNLILISPPDPFLYPNLLLYTCPI